MFLSRFVKCFLIFILGTSAASANDNSKAEQAFTKELIECAAYYQIAHDALSAMNAPQMATVAERLQESKKISMTLAENYQSIDMVNKAVADAANKQMASLPANKTLSSLMQRYKDVCQEAVTAPEKRLDYWIMSTIEVQ